MAIYSGETVNDAIEKGLKDLGIDKKHAKISVIQEPKPGILGKFRKEAKVEIIILTDADLEALQNLVNSTRNAKKTQKNTNLYDSYSKPNFVITDEIPSDKVKPKIIC